MKHIPHKSWQRYCYVSILQYVGSETCIAKTNMSTQLFLYCSGRERSLKCVRPALEIEASKEEQRGLVRFLVAEGLEHAINLIRLGMLSDRFILLHDNARPHTANLVSDKLQRFG